MFSSDAPGGRPDYSLVVPAFNEETLLSSTLASAREAMSDVPWAGEIVVCDNNSTDRTAEIARAAGARVVFEPVNQISRARNTGARAARGDWLVWLDADTTLTPGLLGRALDRLASERCVGGGSTIHVSSVRGVAGALILRLWTWASVRWGLAAGSFVFSRRDAFEAVGGFSEKIYASEEVWFSRAIRRWGRRRGLSFDMIVDEPLVTSARKTEWYSPLTLATMLVLFTVFPFLTRSRRFCFLWYRRPAVAGRDR